MSVISRHSIVIYSWIIVKCPDICLTHQGLQKRKNVLENLKLFIGTPGNLEVTIKITY